MLIIPTAAVASQVLTTQPADQQLTLSIYQTTTGLYLDLAVGSAVTPVLYGMFCRDRVRLVRDTYWGITGDLMWVDLQGASDPSYEGLGTRWVLFWLSADDVEGLPGS